MATATDIIMFVTPLVTAIIFTLLTLAPKGKDKPSSLFSGTLITLMSSILAAISWGIFGLTWPALATMPMFVSIAYLWYVVGIIFAIFAVYVGARMLGTIFETKQPILQLQRSVDGDGDD